jgi:hypothetical protein
MKFDCFYKMTVTKGNRDTVWWLGRFPYSEVIKIVEKHYAEGADAVTLEMIREEEFYGQMPQG